MSDIQKTGKRSGKSSVDIMSAMGKGGHHVKRGVHPPAREEGLGSLTIVTPAEELATDGDQLRVEYATEGLADSLSAEKAAPAKVEEKLAEVISGAADAQ